MSIRWNKYQTPLEELHLDKEPQEIQDNFWDFLNNVPYIRALVSEDRPRACDLKRDEYGRIIVDIAKPHILENMEYFMPSALEYKKIGKYTSLRPNPNPNSEFGKWIREEVRRCYEGYVRPSDGEWVTGNMYFFLNYCPIAMTKTTKGSKKGERVIDFPEVWEGIYYRFHYIEQARSGGIYCEEGGKNGSEVSSRGKSKSYTMASIMAKYFVLGESKDVKKAVKAMATAYQKQYLTSDGILNKFQSYIDFLAENTQFPSKRLKSSLQDMAWKMGYTDLDTGTQKGTLNEVLGVSAKDDPAKVRGKRMHFICVEEFGSFKNILDTYNVMLPSVREGDFAFGFLYLIGCCCAGTKVWTLDGKYINIENLKQEDGIIGYSNTGSVNNPITTFCNGITKEPIGKLITTANKPCYRITLSNGNSIECSEDHPIYIQLKHHPRIGNYRPLVYEERFREAKNIKIGDRVCELREVFVFGNSTLFDARLLGMLIGDGSYGLNNTPKFSSEDEELLNYIKNKYETECNASHITKKGLQYEEIRIKGICSNLREVGIYGQTKTAKRLPNNYQTLDYNNTVELLSGLYDTNGCIYFNKINSSISLTQSNREILEEVKILLRKLGIIGAIVKIMPRIIDGRKDKNPWYTLVCAGRINVLNFSRHIKLLVKHKKEILDKCVLWYNTTTSKKGFKLNKDLLIHLVTNVEYLGERPVYNLSACTSHTYLANNIITHNTSGDSESDFQGAQEIIYNPEGYYMYPLPNVFDKEGQGKSKITFFFPGYINRKGCYDKDGNSDVTKAILEILKDRYLVKYNSTDLNTITKTIAEIPIVPQEALLRTRGNMFPVTDLNVRLNEIDSNPSFYDDVYTGQLISKGDGTVEFMPSADIPIREFPLKNQNDVNGAFEIYNMPEKNREGKIYNDRYIAGLDPIDDDQNEGNHSLMSFYIFDLWTDSLAAVYTGRHPYADDCYEEVRKGCIFYNARCLYENNKKGIFAYFSRMNCLYLLADTPEYLRDKDLIKYSAFGNRAKGFNATLPINNYANTLIRDWMIKPIVEVKIIDGEEQEVTIMNLHKIKDRALIKEAILFNSDGNFDRIRALGALMLYREEKIILYHGDMKKDEDKISADYLGNDPFFKTNYDDRFINFGKM